MLHRLHVNRHNIAANRKDGTSARPPFTLKTYRSNTRGHRVELRDPQTGRVIARAVYSPEKPLSCGAVAWIEFDDRNAEVVVE